MKMRTKKIRSNKGYKKATPLFLQRLSIYDIPVMTWEEVDIQIKLIRNNYEKLNDN